MRPPDPERLRRPVLGPLSAEWTVYAATFLAVAVFALLVSGFAPLTSDGDPLTIVPDSVIEQLESGGAIMQVVAVLVREVSRPAGLVLVLAGLVAFGYLFFETFTLSKVPRETDVRGAHTYVLLAAVLAIFEQAGSSVNNFTDRNVDRVAEARQVTPTDIGQTIEFRIPPSSEDERLRALPMLSQEQLGHQNGSETMKAKIEQAIRSEEKRKDKLTAAEIDEVVEDVNGKDEFAITGLTYLRAAAGRDDAPGGIGKY